MKKEKNKKKSNILFIIILIIALVAPITDILIVEIVSEGMRQNIEIEVNAE